MFLKETNFYMVLFEFIYRAAKIARLAEAEASNVAEKIFNAYIDSKAFSVPNTIHKYGLKFNNYSEEFTNLDSNKISQEQFVVELYTKLSSIGDLTEEQVFDGIFYYLLPADKKFLIPYNYQNIRCRLKRDDGPDLEKVYTLSRHFALELFLKDLIGTYNSNYSLLVKSNFDKKILYIIKNNIVLDLSNENDANILKALRKHY